MELKTRIEEKLVRSREALEEIDENLPEKFEEFQELGLVKDGIYKKTEFIIQNILDICAILVKKLKLGIPEDDFDILQKLNKTFDKKTINKIIELRGFRNFLVHRYGNIDDEIAFEDIETGIKDFEKIFDEIEKVIKTQKI
ncbi:MAG: DUF86 domain-containing protein [Candidatus Aenigmarchaeota archaeon]|nr:DUF86 domain-containing protein [Candidatus Aenigmarchaeota archaeon]